MNAEWNVVQEFEVAVADYAHAPFAVAVDTCASALFLCCKRLKVGNVAIPKRTHISVPSAIIHAGGSVTFTEDRWVGTYPLLPYPIIDSACRFRRAMYRPHTLWCLSFQYRKHLPIGRGGMILCDDLEAYRWFKLARFWGRQEVPLTDDNPTFVGWQMFMEPERAVRGLSLLSAFGDRTLDLTFDYPDLSQIRAFQ